MTGKVIHVAFGRGGGRVPDSLVREVREMEEAIYAEDGPIKAVGERVRDPLADLYSAGEVARLFGVLPSRIRYWDRTGFLAPSGRRGPRRLYTFGDLLCVRMGKNLADGGLSPQRARKVVASLRALLSNVTAPLDVQRVTWDGNSVAIRHSTAPTDPYAVFDFDVSQLRDHVVRGLDRYKELSSDRRTAYELYLAGCRLDEDETTFDQAEQAYLRAIELDPGLANALTNLGNVRFRRGFVDEAEIYYRKAISIDETQPDAYYNLAYLHYERGETRSAVTFFERALAADPAFADAHFNLAMALEESDERRGARQHWQVYLQLQPYGPWSEEARRRLRRL